MTPSIRLRTVRLKMKSMLFAMSTLIVPGALAMGSVVIGSVVIASLNPALAAAADFGPSNPFYAPSTLPF